MNDRLVIETIVDKVLAELLVGRAATFRDVAILMMERVKQAGNGDHLEIGVLFGATLIMAAMVKETFCLTGKVVGLDPLDGYYPAGGGFHPNGKYSKALGIEARVLDKYTGMAVSLENLNRNIYYFGMQDRIEVVKAFSYPWPDELKYRRFVSAYIDGDHWDAAPGTDWENVYPRVKRNGIVWFDDVNELFPDVQKAVKAACDTPGWEELPPHNRQNFYLIRKG